jgi:AraC family transcriptional regulator of adaptative response/methylated-DNA-[protein]-cysteine methyltransferase
MMSVMAVDREQAPAPFVTDEARWSAVVRRDRSADGAFYYAVSTTGVYCRPSCASRLARRDHVSFHETSAAAERAGFRPCKRCRPNGPALEARHAAAVAAACRLIETADQPPELDQLAHAAGLSRFHFHRVFTDATGLTPKAYASAHRARRLRGALHRGDRVTDAIYNAGFGSSSRFYGSTAAALGMSPSAFRSGGRGATIRFAVAECSLGSILVAATDKGVCAILLGDDPDALVREVQDRFPQADLVKGDETFNRLVSTVVGFVEHPGRGLGLPLHVRGTAFQQRVWQALREIPPGQTVSYGELARQVGHPRAVRAVAQACGSNVLAVAIPCHRVVRLDGSPSGYRWGIERKRELLERELGDASGVNARLPTPNSQGPKLQA